MEFKKFNASSYRKELAKFASELESNELYEMQHGVYKLWLHLNNYCKMRYGAGKRLDDLTEYLIILQNAYLKKVNEEEKRLPY